MKENIITVVGSLNFDIIFKQKRFAQIGETYTADSVNFTGGGKGANQAVQCAKLGAKTHMVGAVGKDSFGNILRKQLTNYGVNVDYVSVSDENTGLGDVNALENGTLIATISTGANFMVNRKHIDEAGELIKRSKIVIFQMEIPIDVVEYAIGKASLHNCFIILNAAPAKYISEHALAKVNCLVVNEPEASFYCGEEIKDLESADKNYKKLYAKIKELLVITMGKNGSLIYDGKTRLHVPTNNVKAIETTGAGDSFIGALAYKFLQDCDYEEAAKFATRAAEVTITKVGAQSAMPTLEEIRHV